MLGIVPAAGRGSRIQPLGFSKELLPVGSSIEGEAERTCAVCDYLLDRFVKAGVDRLCFVIGPDKSDILSYIGADYRGIPAAFVVQPAPEGLCDAVFRAAPLVRETEAICIGLPDTIWFPETALCDLDSDRFSCVLFPVDRPQVFDAVALDGDGKIEAIQVKQPNPSTHWIWGAMQMPGSTFLALKQLWVSQGQRDEYLGSLINAWLHKGGVAWGVKSGMRYFDVGTMTGFRTAVTALSRASSQTGAQAVATAG